MLHRDLEPYMIHGDDHGKVSCCLEQEAAFSVLHEKSIDITKYDLIKILEEYPESYRIDYNQNLGALKGDILIASHRGADYHSKSGGARGHSFPTLGNREPYMGGFQIDAKTKRILYNPNAMVDGRDSYFLSKNTLQTQVPLEPILYQLLLQGYTMWQTTYLRQLDMTKLHEDFMTSFHMTEAIKNTFFDTTGFSPKETYLVEGPIDLLAIQKNNLLSRKGWPAHGTQKELIEILQTQHRTTSR